MPASAWVEMIRVILGASGSRLLTAQIFQEDLFFRPARSTLDLLEDLFLQALLCVYMYMYMCVARENLKNNFIKASSPSAMGFLSLKYVVYSDGLRYMLSVLYVSSIETCKNT